MVCVSAAVTAEICMINSFAESADVAPSQENGPSAEEVAKVTRVEQRKWETALQENLFWHELLVNMLQHRVFFKARPRTHPSSVPHPFLGASTAGSGLTMAAYQT